MRKREKKKSYLIKGIIVLAIILTVVGLAFVINGYMSDVSYDDEESFNKFAKSEFKEYPRDNALNGEMDIKEKVNYKDPLSYATSYVKVKNSIVGNFIDEYMKTLEKEMSEYENKNLLINESKYERAAFITRYGTYQGDSGTGSILLSTERFSQPVSNELNKDEERIKCFNFLKKEKLPVSFNNVFNSEKREELNEYISGKLESKYKDTLKDNYKKIIESSNLENFILNGKDAEFIFSSDSITEGKDAVKISVSESDVPGLFKDEIKVRALDPEKPMVALTFDDGPDPQHTEKIIDFLHDKNAVATYYLVGEKLESVDTTERMLKKMLDNGDEIGTHSYDHSNLFALTDKQVKEQNDKTDRLLKEIGGVTPTSYRPPFGNGNDKTTKIFDKPGVLWSVDTLDWKTRNKDSIVKEIKKIEDLNGHVILMHSIYDCSYQATKEIVPWLQSKGYQLVTVSELLQYKYNVNPSDKNFYGYGYFHTVNK